MPFSRLTQMIPLVLTAALTACSSKPCVAGQSVACTGPSGCSGNQVCEASGDRYGACSCGAGGGSAGAGGSGGAAGGTGGAGGAGGSGGSAGGTAAMWHLETSGVSTPLRDVHGSDATHIYAVGDGEVVLFSTGNGTWTRQSLSPVPDLTVHAVSVFATPTASHLVRTATTGTMITSGLVFSNTDGGWVQDPINPDPSIPFALAAVPGDSLYYAGVSVAGQFGQIRRPTLARRNATNGTWDAVYGSLVAGQLHDLSFVSSGEAYAVGGTATRSAFLRRNEDGGWSPMAVPAAATTTLRAVAPLGAVAYAVGDMGRILVRTDAGVVEEQTSTTSQNLNGVYAAGPSDIFAVGAAGTVLRSSGNGTWTPMTSGLTGTPDFTAIWGTSATNLYATAANGEIWHFRP